MAAFPDIYGSLSSALPFQCIFHSTVKVIFSLRKLDPINLCLQLSSGFSMFERYSPLTENKMLGINILTNPLIIWHLYDSSCTTSFLGYYLLLVSKLYHLLSYLRTFFHSSFFYLVFPPPILFPTQISLTFNSYIITSLGNSFLIPKNILGLLDT